MFTFVFHSKNNRWGWVGHFLRNLMSQSQKGDFNSQFIMIVLRRDEYMTEEVHTYSALFWEPWRGKNSFDFSVSLKLPKIIQKCNWAVMWSHALKLFLFICLEHLIQLNHVRHNIWNLMAFHSFSLAVLQTFYIFLNFSRLLKGCSNDDISRLYWTLQPVDRSCSVSCISHSRGLSAT